MQNISRDFLPICSASYLADSSLADCYCRLSFWLWVWPRNFTCCNQTLVSLAFAPLAMWEFPTSRLSVSSATAVIFQVNTNSQLLCNSTYIGFTKIRCQHRPPSFGVWRLHTSKLCESITSIHRFTSNTSAFLILSFHSRWLYQLLKPTWRIKSTILFLLNNLGFWKIF